MEGSSSFMLWIFFRFSPLVSSSWRTYEMRLHTFNFCLLFYLLFSGFYSTRLCSVPLYNFLWVFYWVVWGLRGRSIWDYWMSLWNYLLSWVSDTNRFLGFLGQCTRMGGNLMWLYATLYFLGLHKNGFKTQAFELLPVMF